VWGREGCRRGDVTIIRRHVGGHARVHYPTTLLEYEVVENAISAELSQLTDAVDDEEDW
jgi:hypothetical protein